MTDDELEEVIRRLRAANAQQQQAASASRSGFIEFLRSVGLFALAKKVGDLLSWTWEHILDILGGIFGG